MLTETNTIYGQAAYGGKIHRTTADGHAWCLSGNGHKPMRTVVVEIPAGATRQEETDALRAAGVKPEKLCSKCCSTSKNLLESDIASDRTAQFYADACGGTLVEEQDDTVTITISRDDANLTRVAILNASNTSSRAAITLDGISRHDDDRAVAQRLREQANRLQSIAAKFAIAADEEAGA